VRSGKPEGIRRKEIIEAARDQDSVKAISEKAKRGRETKLDGDENAGEDECLFGEKPKENKN